MDLQQGATDVLQRLIRFNTVNPPGNERPAQEYLAGLLREAGFEVELLGRTEERPNLVARLRGASDGPVLCLLSHVDTVLADAEDWQRDPWSGDLADDFVWGRGAQDMKSQTAAEVAAGVSLAGEGWRPARGDLLIVAVVDEESGGTEGALWLTENHPDKVRCDELLNEGAGTVIPFEGRPVYGVCVAEKGVHRFTLTTDGVAGHASFPRVGDNALLKLAPLLEAMRDRRPGFDVAEAPRLLFDRLGVALDDDPGRALESLRDRDPALATMVEPMLSITLAPTQAAGSEQINVIPARAKIRVDCRTPPGMGAEETLARVREVLGSDGYRLEFFDQVVGNASPAESELMEAIAGWVKRQEPEADVVPVMLPAYTDSRTFRDAFPDCVAYGFFPQREMNLYEYWPLVHGKNERIHVRDLGFAATFYRDIAKERLG